MKFSDANYITIQGWMISKLKLKGNALIVFAIIYGFTQDDETEFTGSRKYLCTALQCTYPTVDKAIKELLDKKLIVKKQTKIKGVKFNSYKVSLLVVKNLYRGGSKISLQGGSKESLHNNTKILKNTEKKIEKEKFSSSDKYLKLATKLSNIIQSKKSIIHTPSQLKQWSLDFKRLETQNKVSIKRQKTVLKWYKNAIGGQYIPVVESGKAFKEKFSRLEDAIQRESENGVGFRDTKQKDYDKQFSGNKL